MKKLINKVLEKFSVLVLVVIVFLTQLFELKLPTDTNIVKHRDIQQSSSKVINLPHSIIIQIPICADHRLEASIDLVQKSIGLMTRLFGGTNAFQALGSYETQSTEIVNDINVWVESYCNVNNFQTYLPIVINWVQEIGMRLNQESMIVIVNREAHLIFVNNNEQNKTNV